MKGTKSDVVWRHGLSSALKNFVEPPHLPKSEGRPIVYLPIPMRVVAVVIPSPMPSLYSTFHDIHWNLGSSHPPP